MTEERTAKPAPTRGYKPIHEKVIPAAVVTLVVISIGMLVLAGAIALGLVGSG